MSHRNANATTRTGSKAKLATVLLAVAMWIPVTGIAAEWDVAIEGAQTPAREALSASFARLEVGEAGVFVAGIYEEMTRTPAVARYAPSSTEPSWTTMLGNSGYASTLDYIKAQQVVAAADGAALVIGGEVTRLDASGHLQWAAYRGDYQSTMQAAATLPGGDVLAAASENSYSLRRHDGATGKVIRSTRRALCPVHSMVVVDASNAYVRRGCGSSQTPGTVQQVEQIDPVTLEVRWAQTPGEVHAIAADTSGVYAADGNVSIRKLAAADGSFVWNFFRSPGLRLLGTTVNGDLVAAHDVGSAGSPIKRIERVNRMTGVSLWSRDVAGAFTARVSGDAVVMTGATNVGGVDVPFVRLLDLDSGAVAWQVDIDVPTGTRVRIADAVVNGSRVAVLRKLCPGLSGEVRCDVTMWHLQRASGVVAATQPLMVRSAVASDTKTSADGTIWTAAIDWTTGGQRLRLFAHSPGTGAVVVETTVAAPMSTTAAALPADTIALAIGTNGHIAVMLKRQRNFLGVHDAVVFSFDAVGAFRWRKSLLAELAGQTGVAAHLASVDSAGNVLLGKQELFGQPNSWTGYMVNKRWMARLASATGNVEWQREFPAATSGLFFTNPPQGMAVDDDILVREAPIGETWTGISRLSGEDGDTEWTNADAPQWSGIHRPDPLSVLTVGTRAPAATVRINQETGVTQWTTQYPFPDDQSFFTWKVLETGIDDRYLLSTTRVTSDQGVSQNGALVLSVDAQTGNVEWANRFESDPASRFERMDPFGVANGRIHATGESRSVANFVIGMTTLDASSGLEQDARALWASTWRVVGNVPQGVGDLIKLVGTDALLQWPLRSRLGEAPYLSLARRELAQQTASVDIAVSLDWTPTTIGGAPATQIIYTAANAGPDSAEAVRSVIDMPPDSPLLDVTCTIDATPCSVDIGAAWIQGVHTIPAGAELVISTRFVETATFEATALYSASAIGSFRLVEPTLNDNFAESDFGSGDLILRTGFDP